MCNFVLFTLNEAIRKKHLEDINKKGYSGRQMHVVQIKVTGHFLYLSRKFTSF